ncbi:DNA (cytosine-5)-methyltransferase DRM2-like isoform X2 [Macadamia integrifolia]|uniref:DNA (cytosine-5)-methyltransferase DRM2-like isoform X2 n=2 Tax=Macadamia integrifolia TaxID=60698 RepID=UPI001C533EF8|nr:DNA (cytosine-5)-methyltransferase DRM2-like isoform X2 [Macadamia integrifolia]
MDWNDSSKSSDSLQWIGEDEEEVNSNTVPFHSSSNFNTHEASTSAGPHSSLFSYFVGMGFSKNMVVKAIKENGEGNTNAILETLLTYSMIEKSPSECELIPYDTDSSESKMDDLDQLSDISSCLGDEETIEHLSDREKKFLQLMDMGFPIDDASSALEKCGPDTSIMELMDFISAAQIGKIHNPQLHPILDENKPGSSNFHTTPDKKRKKLFEAEERWQKKVDSWRRRQKESYKERKKSLLHEDEETVRVPKPMKGFGLPNMQMTVFNRKIPSEAIGPPFFYFENVALAPKGVWDTISRFLYDIQPEFVDSVYFCAAARKRGYIHNLPIQNRFPLQPIPPLTIQDTFPLSKKWWPSWDKRTKFNCLNTCTASAKLTERIKKALESWDGEPHPKTQKYILFECKKWNLVWVGKNRAAPLDPEEIEVLMGFPKHHTRGGGTSRTERFRSLGNSFQVDTVAFHLSVLKKMFPHGISVLSLFSGIGGAEVALHRLGIPLKNVVSVEISNVNRNILQSWWDQTNQKGNLIHVADVQKLSIDRLEELIKSLGGFDLIIGGSPCNNLTGSNRVSRDGLQGEQSILFYEYFRVLNDVKFLMGKV